VLATTQVDSNDESVGKQSLHSREFDMYDIKRRHVKGKLITFNASAGSLGAIGYAPASDPRPRVGYGFGVTTMWPSLFSRQLELVLHLISMRKTNSFSFQMQWHLSLPNIVPRKSTIFQLVIHGDIAGMQAQFDAGTYHPFCVSPSGVTLLHVSTLARI
jgi:hypothetical protein